MKYENIIYFSFSFRLVEIVEKRNEIVECLEMDRRREVEEDRSINKHMGLFAGKQCVDRCINIKYELSFELAFVF